MVHEELTEQAIKDVVKANIKSFDIKAFCPNGGWPMLEDVDVQVGRQVPSDEGWVIDMDLWYDCQVPTACSCITSSIEKPERLSCTVRIADGRLTVLKY